MIILMIMMRVETIIPGKWIVTNSLAICSIPKISRLCWVNVTGDIEVIVSENGEVVDASSSDK